MYPSKERRDKPCGQQPRRMPIKRRYSLSYRFMLIMIMVGLGLGSTAWAQKNKKSSATKVKKKSKFVRCKFPSHASADVANEWKELKWKKWTRAKLDDSSTNRWRVFKNKQPKCSRNKKDCNQALTTDWIDLTVYVYIQGSEIWSQYKQLANYFILTRNYFRQARINLKFKCYEPPRLAADKNRSKDNLSIIFGKSVLNPAGELTDGFGNLPRGLAAINDQIMERRQTHANPYFLPGKPVGHELGHVLGLGHVENLENLMAQGTTASNQLKLKPVQALIMRVMALHRFGGKVSKTPKWAK